MAIYVTSDLHGARLEDLKKILTSVNFGDNDWLYILGDVVDRENDGGVEILKWLLLQPNVELILGNHEAMLLSCDFLFDEVTDQSINEFDTQKMSLLMNYMQNGGDVTLKALRSLMRTDPETVKDILDYLRECPLYEVVSVNEKDFVLVHSGFADFDKSKRLSDYTPDELLWARPTLDDVYFENAMTVFGHTPTIAFGPDHKGKILRTRTWVDIDVGVSFGNPIALLRLDDMQEFYLSDRG